MATQRQKNQFDSCISAPLLLIFLIMLSKISLSKENVRYLRQTDDYEMHVPNCDNKGTYNSNVSRPIQFYPNWRNKSGALPELRKKYDYVFTITKIENRGEKIEQPVAEDIPEDFYTSEGLVVHEYFLTPGKYALSVKAKIIKEERDLPLQASVECFIVIQGIPPLVKIKGGDYKMVADNTELHFDGTHSFNLNLQTISNKDLYYNWTCTQKIQPPTICTSKVLSTDGTFSIPGDYVKEDDVIIVTLNVTTSYADTAEKKQTIDVVSNAANLDIRCQKNCPPLTDAGNYKYLTFVSVWCDKNCEGIKDNEYQWTVESLSDKSFVFDYEKMTDFGRNGYKLAITANSLKPGDYIITVELVPESIRRGKASLTVSFVDAPDIQTCYINPKQGKTTGDFFLYCVPKNLNMRTFLELYVVEENGASDEELILREKFPEILNIPFKLPPSEGRKFFVRVSLLNGLFTEKVLDAKVTPVLEKNSPVNKIQEMIDKRYFNNKVKMLIRSKDNFERKIGFSSLKSVVDELLTLRTDDKEVKSIIDDFKKTVATDLFNSPLNTLDDTIQAAEIAVKLMQFGDEESRYDPHVSQMVTTVCRKMLEKQRNALEKAQFPLNLSIKMKKLSNTMTKCFETNTNPNYDIIQPIEIQVKTVPPTIDEPKIVEDYANYIDFSEEYYQMLDFLKESTINIINGTTSAAKLIALTTVVGEKFVEGVGRATGIIVAKDKGRVLAQKTVRCLGVSVVPSADWNDTDHFFDVLMSTWTKDILWWNVGHVTVATDIVNVQFWHSTCKDRVEEFKHPADVFLEVKKNTTFGVRIFEEKYSHSVSKYDQMTVRRVTLPQGTALYVQYYNLSSVLEVVVTKFRFPTTKDFKYEISSSNSSLHFPNNEDFNIWVYVGVLINTDISYQVSFAVASCLRWEEKNSSWTPTCKVGNELNASVINCKCRHFSVLAGHIQHLPSLPQVVLAPNLELELQSTSIIFTTVVITWTLYCILSVFTIFTVTQGLYFLADNNLQHQYAYLVTVKSGTGRKSGTSSNVTIRLIGTKKSSDPHVLNYPDPAKCLLQRHSKDVFVLTTKYHLGEVTHVELWNDSIGYNPAWYCQEVIVYDMQEKEEWRFKVGKRLCAFKGHSYVKVGRDVVLPWYKNLGFNLRYHSWWIIQNEEHFSYLKKLTVVLSKILTTYLIVLLLVGVPSFQVNDGLDRYYYSVSGISVFYAFVASFSSFVLHGIIVTGFRKSQLQFFRYEQKTLMSFYVTYICWIVLTLMITLSITFLTTYGFWLPRNKSWEWLTISAIGTSFDIFIYETLMVLVQTFLYEIKTIDNLQEKISTIYEEIETQRLFLYNVFGSLILRPYFTHLYEPLKNPEVKETATKIKQRREVIAELEDLVMFVVYVVTLYVIVLANKDHFMVLSKSELEDVMEGKHTGSISFSEIGSLADMYTYTNSTFIPSLQPLYWYGNYTITEPGLMIDGTNKYLGIARLRQHRMMTNVCLTAEPMRFLNTTCWPEYTKKYQETRLFGYGWGPYSGYLQYDRLKSIWGYTGTTGTFPTDGKFAQYSGGGYLAYLGRTLYNSVVNFRTIFQKIWIDDRTRSVFVEFLTYNVNVNVFNAVRLIFEQSATGFTTTTIQVVPVRMVFVENEMQKVVVVFFGLFVVWVGVLFVKHSLGVLRKFRTFYKDVWFLLDLIIVAMSIVCIVVFYQRIKMVGWYLKDLAQARHNEFLSYFYLFYIEDFLTVFAATLVCLATVRLWKFLRFGVFFRLLERTLSLSVVPLLTVLFIFTFISIGTTKALLYQYGSRLEVASDFLRLLRALMTVTLDAGDIKAKEFIPYPTGVFILTFYFVFAKVMDCIFIMVIVMAYNEAQLEFSKMVFSYNIKNYVMEQKQYLPRYLKYKYMRLRAGQEPLRNKVEPKPEKFLYNNSFSVMTHKMKTMEVITKCVLRNLRQKNQQYDQELMMALTNLIMKKKAKEEVDVFFKGRIKGDRVRFVDEQRVEKIANFVNLLLLGEAAFKNENQNDEKRKKGEIRCLEAIKKTVDSVDRCYKLVKLLEFKLRLL